MSSISADGTGKRRQQLELGSEMAHTLDDGKKRFRKLVSKATECAPRLPLIHGTDTYVLSDVVGDGVLKPQQCSVFGGEALTYFFYGRPAFRPNNDAAPSGMNHYFPICLIFKPDWAPPIKRVFPFDSGAFQADLYSNYLHDKMKLGDFALETDISTPGKVVSLFFGSNSAYLKGRPERLPSLDPTEFEAASYAAIVAAKEGNAIDSRGSGIEVQGADAIDIKKAVAAVVLPSIFASSSVGDSLKNCGIDLLPYWTYERMRPGEYMSKLTEICMRYFISMKLISDTDL